MQDVLNDRYRLCSFMIVIKTQNYEGWARRHVDIVFIVCISALIHNKHSLDNVKWQNLEISEIDAIYKANKKVICDSNVNT